MRSEVGVIYGGPVSQAWKQVKTIFRTWAFCRKNKLSCNKWYGVYVEGTEDVLATVGPLPGAKERAEKIAKTLNSSS